MKDEERKKSHTGNYKKWSDHMGSAAFDLADRFVILHLRERENWWQVEIFSGIF